MPLWEENQALCVWKETADMFPIRVQGRFKKKQKNKYMNCEANRVHKWMQA